MERKPLCLSAKRDLASTRQAAHQSTWREAQFEMLEPRLLLSADPTLVLSASLSSGGLVPQSVVTADFNNDDIADLAVANHDGHNVGVLLGSGDGTFIPAATFPAGGYTPTGVAVADFDRDGSQDLVVANWSSTTVSVLFGIGNGGFESARTYYAGGPFAEAITAGDFNGDDLPDIAVARYYGSSTRVVGILLGTGSRNFASVKSFTTGGSSPLALAAGQLDDNNRDDLAVANYYDGTIGVLLSNPDGTLASAVTYSSGGSGPRSIALADFNGDGTQDIAVTNVGAAVDNVGVLLGDGTGSFGVATTFLTGGSALNRGGVAAGDFNADGNQDIAVTNYDSGTVAVLVGNGAGTFSDAVAFDADGAGVNALAVADFNADGALDVAVVNDQTHNVSILLNTASANHEPSVGADNSLVTVNEGDAAQNTGYFADEDAGDTVTVTASLGTIAQDAGNSGSWTWVFTTSDGPDEGQVVTITATDSEGAATSTTFELVVNNVAPTANDDTYTTTEDGVLEVDAASGLLVNDTDPGSDDLLAALVDAPAHGTLTVNEDGSFTYTPSDNFNGTDSFTYRAQDGESDSNVATATIAVSAVNDQPTAESQAVSTWQDEAVDITLVGSDVETPQSNLLFTVVSLPSSGLLMRDGTPVEAGETFDTPVLTYVPGAESDDTEVSFTFTVTDAGDGDSPALESAPAAVTVGIQHYSGVTVSNGILKAGGTAAADIITSTGGVLVINGATISTDGLTEIRVWAGDGDDRIDFSGLSIPVFVYGGAGDDEIIGGASNDVILGGTGNDSVIGGNGDDMLIGGDNADRLVGSAGADVLVSGSLGSDATESSIRDLLAAWADSQITTEEDDTADVLVEQDDGTDVLTGSSGADWFIISLGDRITGVGRFKALIAEGIPGLYGDDWVTFV